MVLSVRVHCGYPSYVESGEGWNQHDWAAFKLVQALKGRPINGYANLQRPNGAWLQIAAENPQSAFDLFGEWAELQIRQQGPLAGLIVPVPASDCLALGADPKGRRLAEAVTSRLAHFEVSEALCWAEQFPKASEGGPRDAPTLFGNLLVRTEMQPRHIVLVDDVTTSGGHLLACAQGLRAFGHVVEYAICGARTVHHHPQQGMFSLAAYDLEAAPLAGVA
jgi:hypothetical protein